MITNQQKREIKELRENCDWTMRRIAEKFNVSYQRIQQIIKSGYKKHNHIPHGKFYLIMEDIKVSQIRGRGRTRMIVRMRDSWTCQNCGEILTPKQAREQGKRLFDVHHTEGFCGKKSRGYDSVKEIDKLITLCHKCHFKRHDFSKRLTGEWLKVSSCKYLK